MTAFRLAQVVEHFHLTLEQAGELTDRQIAGILFHARDKEGRLSPPLIGPQKEQQLYPLSLEEELEWLEPMKSLWGEQQYEEAIKKVKQLWESGTRQKQLEKILNQQDASE